MPQKASACVLPMNTGTIISVFIGITRHRLWDPLTQLQTREASTVGRLYSVLSSPFVSVTSNVKTAVTEYRS